MTDKAPDLTTRLRNAPNTTLPMGVMWTLCEQAADRIEELEAELREARMQSLSDLGQAHEAYERQKELEAKVQALVDALERIASASDFYGVEANAEDQGADTLAYAHKSTSNRARATLAALKGQDDE